ncbi:hypothetical protein SF1_13700 [Sphingobacterium faecium NBRC 15299]|uniref:hypothetical protein n=1 Tax=Sphingobacterium faecium TaxID=34087 RepID=UPI000D3968D5|nr:hypothetical protein [Sphingobacterium faecium]PTX11837.1 hypothetical protein C8N37_103414 [Sphingobacterium faecium]GEM63388.1 hypothetical protein SF1_13700 [Sphingobacterium faecium NBRC 15299]
MTQTNADIFNNIVFNLPKKRDENSVDIFLENTYNDYLNEIKKFGGDLQIQLKTLIPFIENQITLIKESLTSYLQGSPSIAFDILSRALNLLDINDYLPIQKMDLDTFNPTFYRLRISDSKTLDIGQLFHIPFEIREKVSTQRYSIPGFPCLYLGDSIFVCWEELGRPDLNTFYASRFDLSQSKLKFLFFDTFPNEVKKKCFPKKNHEGKLFNLLLPYLCYWPLLAACSLMVKKPNEVFKPEYIIPQLLLQWVVSVQKVDGVVYKSNRIKESKHAMGTFRNVVIPVKTNEPNGICPQLKKKIKLTNPISYQLLIISGNKASPIPVRNNDLHRVMFVEIIEGEKSVYSDTIFGQLESKLGSLPAKYI